MKLEELIRLNKFELCLILLREWPELSDLRLKISYHSLTWEQAISNPSYIKNMDWLDYNAFKRQVTLQVSRYIKDAKNFGAKLEIIICKQFDYCKKTNLPVSTIMTGLAKALSDSLPENVANVIAALLFSHDSLRILCKCALSP
ncbi:hypothetical protein [uncultured Xanthomonas sp.]|uniref:hypothetical protein n=1 Tax=uncultured Xanthomonas sp. TaxID=152831 RepID=UPI0025D7A508|nr:hypothetical protein [uncultured Xanthomonas sp.]